MDEAQFQRIAKALSDPRRREILEIIARSCEEASPTSEAPTCSILTDKLPIGQPTVSHHLKELVYAGLIEIQPDGQRNRLLYQADVARDYLKTLSERLVP